MSNRGSIPRRRQNPDREPPKTPPAKVIASPVYHAPGAVTVPSNGSVKILERRFPKIGTVRDASLQIPDLPADTELRCEVWADGELLAGTPIVDALTVLERLLVDDEMMITVHIAQIEGESDVQITPNVAYMYQEKIRAKAVLDIR